MLGEVSPLLLGLLFPLLNGIIEAVGALLEVLHNNRDDDGGLSQTSAQEIK